MSLVFTETLRGSYFLVDAPDDVRVCEVQVVVHLSRPRALVRRVDGPISGSATFAGLATHAPIEGALRVETVRPRRVSYEFVFATTQGKTRCFRGAKHPSMMRPLYSATTLWGSLFDGDRAIAMVSLHFDLRRDLVAFLQSVEREANGSETE